MAVTLTTAQYNVLQHAINQYVLATAPENQIHDEFIEEIVGVIVATGFIANTGLAQQKLQDRPLTTLLGFAAFLGHP
jgi:hypothetical protein